MPSYLSSTFRSSRRRFAGLLLIIVLLVLAGVLLLRHPNHFLRVRACFQDVNGLATPAFVRIAGVEVGRVRSVRAQPTNPSCPADVEMDIVTDYPLSLPSDAVASVSTAGFLGSLYVAIDATHASGPPVESGGQIRSQENTPVTAASLERIVKGTAEMLKAESHEQKSGATGPQKPGVTKGTSPKSHSN